MLAHCRFRRNVAIFVILDCCILSEVIRLLSFISDFLFCMLIKSRELRAYSYASMRYSFSRVKKGSFFFSTNVWPASLVIKSTRLKIWNKEGSSAIILSLTSMSLMCSGNCAVNLPLRSYVIAFFRSRMPQSDGNFRKRMEFDWSFILFWTALSDRFLTSFIFSFHRSVEFFVRFLSLSTCWRYYAYNYSKMSLCDTNF